MSKLVAQEYERLVFGNPRLVILALSLFVAFFAWHAQNFRLDASADSLLLENDPVLEFSREVSDRYGTGDSVIVAYSPKKNLFDRDSLARLTQLRDHLLSIPRVDSVDSILNVPVFGDTPLTGISEDYLTILDEEQDLELAQHEIMANPVFQNALLSLDGKTAGLLIAFEIDERSRELLFQRRTLQNSQRLGELTPNEYGELQRIEAEYAEYSVFAADQQHELIGRIRGVLEDYKDEAEIFLGGAPMIADDLVTFVEADLRTFSIAVVLLIIVALGLIFKKLRWIAMPLLCCGVAGTIMVGILGLMDWRVTVVSSNFISLLLIITISLF